MGRNDRFLWILNFVGRIFESTFMNNWFCGKIRLVFGLGIINYQFYQQFSINYKQIIELKMILTFNEQISFKFFVYKFSHLLKRKFFKYFSKKNQL